MKSPSRQTFESRLLPKKLGSRVGSTMQVEVAKLLTTDFLGVTQVAIERLGAAKLSANKRNSLLAYLVRVAHLELAGEPTTHSAIALQSDATLNTVVSALTRLADLDLLEKTKSSLPTNGLIVSYRISKRLIVATRDAASPRSS